MGKEGNATSEKIVDIVEDLISDNYLKVNCTKRPKTSRNLAIQNINWHIANKETARFRVFFFAGQCVLRNNENGNNY